MKYNIIATVMIIAFIVSCNPTQEQQDQSPESEVMWNSWLKLQKGFGRKVLSDTESEQWIKNNRSKISMPVKLSFMEQHLVMEEPFLQQLTIITVDHNGKYRVVAKGFTYPRYEISNSLLKVGDTLYDESDFIIIDRRYKVKELYQYKNGVETHSVVFESGGIVSGTDKKGTTSTYISKSGATIHLDTNRNVTKIEGSVDITKKTLIQPTE